MSNALVALLFSLGAAAWVYAKVQKTTGNNTQSSLTVAGVVGFLVFIAVLTIMSYLPE